MSVDSALARVAQLNALMNRGAPVQNPATTPATAGANASSFSTQLQQASTAASASSANVASTPVSGRGGDGSQYDSAINAAAARNNVPPALLKGLIRAESGFNPNAGSPAGAQGLCQLMPATARGLGVTNLKDPIQSIEGGAKYLSRQLQAFGGNTEKALAAYNAGPGAVQRYNGVPPYAETQNYVKRVLGYAAEYGGGATT